MPMIDDVTAEVLEGIEEQGAKAEETTPASETTAVAESGEQQPTPSQGTALAEIEHYEGDEIDSGRVFATEMREIERRRKQSPAYKRRLAEVARFYGEVLAGRRSLMQLHEAMFSSEFTALLGDTLDRVLLARYGTYSPTYRQFQRRRTVRDFRQVGSVRRHGGNRLTAVAEGETYEHDAVTESSYQFGVSKYGKVYSLTWEAMINDDLDAFSSLPDEMAMDAVQTEMFLASQLYVANTTLYATNHDGGDGNTYSNKDTAALAVAALKAAWNTMAGYPGDGGNPLLNAPIWLVVPPQLELDAIEILGTLQVQWAGGDSQAGVAAVAYPTRNALATRLQVIVDPFIPILDTTNGATSWYLFSNPAMIHAAEYGLLRGYEQPQVFMRSPNATRLGGGPAEVDFDDDTRGYKVRHVFGGSHANAAGGWRATYWSDGTT